MRRHSACGRRRSPRQTSSPLKALFFCDNKLPVITSLQTVSSNFNDFFRLFMTMSDVSNRIDETDEVGNLVATYVQSSSRSGVNTSRIDIIVRSKSIE